MRRFAAVAVFMFVGATTLLAQSALLNLPRASQHARVLQRIGITDITVDYSRPLVRGRKIFGGVQSYGKVWRAGANENTTIEFTDDVTVDGHPLAKGVYGVHFIPGEDSWAMAFSRNSTSWGSFTYDPAEDALRLTLKPEAIANQEVLRYDFEGPTPTSTMVTMHWEKVALAFKVEVNTPEIVAASLRKQLRGRVQFEWQAWDEAANYLLSNHLSAEEALKYSDSSIESEDRFENEITKSKALVVLGRSGEAGKAKEKALAMGSQQQLYDYARGLQRQGQYDEAIEILRVDVPKDPKSWIGHTAQARMDVAKGNFDAAIAEIKLAIPVAPESLKAQLSDIIVQLRNKVDINK